MTLLLKMCEEIGLSSIRFAITLPNDNVSVSNPFRCNSFALQRYSSTQYRISSRITDKWIDEITSQTRVYTMFYMFGKNFSQETSQLMRNCLHLFVSQISLVFQEGSILSHQQTSIVELCIVH